MKPFGSGRRSGRYPVSGGVQSSSRRALARLAGPLGVVAIVTTSISLMGASAWAAGETISPAANTSPQQTNVGAAFAQGLCVNVSGAGNDSPSITFTAPTSGASGTFANGSTTYTETLGAGNQSCGQGEDFAFPFTANAVPGSYTVTASDVTNGASPASFALTNNGIGPSAGTPQTTKLNSPFPVVLTATVFSGGAPVVGATVTFAAPSSGASGVFAGSGTTATAVTNGQGVATAPSFTANGTAGTYNVTATTPAVAGSAAYVLTNTATGVVSGVSAVSGSGQKANVGSQFANPLQASVVDATGNPVTGANVLFTIVAGSASGTTTSGPGAPSGTFASGGASATVPTDSTGVATSPLVSANNYSGAFTVTASTAGFSGNASFNLTNLAGAPSTLTIAAGGSQATPVNSAFPVALTVTVTDANKNPVPGTAVTFSAPSSGASGTFSGGGNSTNVTTDPNGVATAPTFSANASAGGYVVTASVSGVSPVAFSLVNQAPTASSTGYWMAASDGGVFSYGNAQFYGSAGNLHLAAPIVGMAATPDGRGYWLVASDGGIFTFGDARFYGSTGAMHLNQPVVGMSSTPDGSGYWLVASDGGIFTFGDAGFLGSAGNLPLTQPIISMASTPDGHGYWLAAADGGIFNYGDAGFYGAASQLGDHSIRAMVPSPGGGGYWMSDASGVVYGFGSAPIAGSPAASGVLVASPIVAMATP